MVGEETNGQQRALSAQRSSIRVQCLSSHSECAHSVWGKTTFINITNSRQLFTTLTVKILTKEAIELLSSQNLTRPWTVVDKIIYSHKIMNDKQYIHTIKQESPPAWKQEAYRPPHIKYSICCPILGGEGVPHPWLGGYSIPGYPHPGVGYPPEGTWDQSMGYPPWKNMRPVEVLWDEDGVNPPPPDVNRLKTLPSPSFGCGR